MLMFEETSFGFSGFVQSISTGVQVGFEMVQDLMNSCIDWRSEQVGESAFQEINWWRIECANYILVHMGFGFNMYQRGLSACARVVAFMYIL